MSTLAQRDQRMLDGYATVSYWEHDDSASSVFVHDVESVTLSPSMWRSSTQSSGRTLSVVARGRNGKTVTFTLHMISKARTVPLKVRGSKRGAKAEQAI